LTVGALVSAVEQAIPTRSDHAFPRC
jgi:hypothetical protein